MNRAEWLARRSQSHPAECLVRYGDELVNLKHLSVLTGIPYPTLQQRHARGDRGERLVRKPDPKYARRQIGEPA